MIWTVVSSLIGQSVKNQDGTFSRVSWSFFAGSMIGIRNPHAHENLSLDRNEAKHFVYLASLLMKRFKTAR